MENKELKYKCEKCNYLTNYKSSYDKHLRSILHQTGEKKIRSDKKENKCEKCEKKFSSQQSLKNHIINKHSDIKKELKQRYKLDTRRQDDFIHLAVFGAQRLKEKTTI